MIVCKNCGTQNAENESFCGECGAYLEWEGERVGEPEPVAAVAPPAEAQSNAPGFVRRVKDAVGIGAHDDATAADAPPAGTAAQGAPPQGTAPRSTPSQGTASQGAPPASNAPPASGSHRAAPAAPGTNAPAGPSPWPAAPSPTGAPAGASSPPQPANSGSSMVVPIAPAAPGDRARPAEPATAPAGAPTRPGAQAVRPGVGAVRPGAAPPRPRRRDLPPEDRPPAPGEIICGYCAAGNAPTRKFCRRCGTDLADAPVAKKPPWYKRIFAKQTAKAAPVAGARPKAAKQKKVRKRSGRLRYYLVGFVVICIMLFVFFRSFWVDVYNKVLDHVQDSSKVSVAKISASSTQGRFKVGNLVDQHPNTFWAPANAKNPVGQQVLATFKKPIRLVHIGVYNGASDKGPNFVKQSNVSKIQVVIFRKDHGNETQNFDLKASAGEQTLDIGVSDVTAVRVFIRGVDRPANAGKLVAIAELEFFAR